MRFYIIFLNGCATTEAAKESKGTGTKKIYEKPMSEVWIAMKAAVEITGGKIVEENVGECTILATYWSSAFSWGERVGLFCVELSPTQTEIEVISKRAVAMNITAADWTEKIYAALDKQLE